MHLKGNTKIRFTAQKVVVSGEWQRQTIINHVFLSDAKKAKGRKLT